jgi:hypothetical protein
MQTIRAFLDFCYLARQNILDSVSLQQLEDALSRFHQYRVIFQTSGVRPDGFSLPRQHSLVHYFHMIREFGAPNGLCSSITESKHIKAVKQPWRRSSRFEALGQMLLTNQRLDKLAASRSDFKARGMLEGGVLQTVMSMLRDSELYLVFHFIITLIAFEGLQLPQIPGRDENGYNTDGSDVPGPRTMACTTLGKAIGM